MKRVLKKSLALVLVLTMAVCAATLAVTMRQNALAAEEAVLDWEIISAQYIAGVRDYPDFAIFEGNTANDIFNYYIKDDVYSPSVEMFNSVRNDNGMKALMTTWQVYSLGGSPSSATKKIMQGEDYCETLLVSTLNMSLKDGIIATVLKSKVLGDTKDLRDMFYDFCDLGDDFDLSKNLGEVSDGLTKAVNKKYKETPDKAKSITGKIGDIIKYSKNITEVIQKVATYSSMLDLDDYSKTWLKQMKNANESSIQDPDMRIALNKLIEASESDSGFANVALFESGFTGVEWIVQKGISEGIKALCASSPVVSSIFVGLSVSNTICNLFFSTDDVCEQFFVMDKLEKLQELARSVAKDEQTSFIADQNNINAQRFTKSVELYFRSITEVDCDCMKKFVTNLYEGGYLSDTLALLMGASGNYEAHIDALESLRQARISNYNYMIQYCKCGFRLESESSFLYYFPPEDTEIPITGLSLKPLQSIDSYPEGIDLQVGDFITLFPIYTPSNTTQTGVIYSSSDESIVDVGTSGILFGESVGTATITVTSIYDKNIKTSIDIRVGEKTESSGEPGGIVIPESDFKYTIIDGKVMITGLKNENIKTAKIPSRIEGYPVTSISDYAFRFCTKLTSVTIPKSVTSIGNYAFYNCDELTSITIPDSVTNISDDAFYGCAGLTNVTIPDSVTSIGRLAFSCCTSITSITIPDSVISIGYGAFSGCTSLTGVTIPDSVTIIGSGAFKHCKGLTSVTIGNGVASIGDETFYNCTGLTSITIPDNVISIGRDVFYNTGLYNDSSNWENGVLYIGNHLIEAKNTLSGDYVINSGTKVLADEAFCGCYNLTSVTIPDSVTSIGYYVFLRCSKLKAIIVDESNQYYSSDEFGALFNKNKTELIQYPVGNERTEYIVPNSVMSIGYKAFYNCTGLISVTIGNSVTSIGNSAFAYCKNLTSVTIGNRVRYISEEAFCNCTGLTSVSISDSVTIIGSGAFKHCKGLTSVTIPDSVTSIGDGAFESCDGLTSVTIGNSVTSIGNFAFSDCAVLTSITIPNSVTSIGSYAFYKCTGLTSIEIPDSVISIGNYAFFWCTGFTSVTIPNSVTSIGEFAFDYCTGLTSVTIDNGVTSIGVGAFYDCKTLTSIEIPNSVTSIGDYAFKGCTGLTSVIIPKSVTSIGYQAFYDCSSLNDVYYEGTEEQWKAISISQGNDCIKNAKIHYNCTPCTHILTHINNNATCTKPGTEYNLCSKCGAKLNFKSIPATGHNWSAWTITTVPTVKDDGIEKRICSACGEDETRIITKLNGVYDDSTGIEVIFESESCSATELRVEKSQSDEVLALIKTVSKNSNIAVYDIATYDNGIKVQPSEKVTVRIPIPDGFNPDMIAVYYVDTESDGLTKIPNRVEYGYVIFETDHFSHYAVVDETVLNVSFKKPSTTTIDYGDSIVLHVESNVDLPAGARIEWTADNGNFDMSVSADGTTCKISPKSSGKTVFTATVYDKDGNVISSDTQEMTAKAGLWQKIVAFFKKIFGLTKTIPEVFKGIL